MKKIFFIASLLFTARTNGQPVASPNSVFKLIDGAIFFGAGGVLVTFENLHLDNQGYLNSDEFTIPAASIFRFSGDSTTYIGGATYGGRLGYFNFDRLKVAKSSGAIFQLRRGITIFTSVDFASGLIDLNSQRIFLFGNAVLNGESATSRVIDRHGLNRGEIMVNANLAANTTINPGNLGLEITPSASLTVPGGSTIYRGHHSNDLSTAQFSNPKSVLRYYRIGNDYRFNQGSNFNAKVRFHYFDEELNGINENTLSMWQNWNWLNPPWTHVGLSTSDATNNYVEQTITIGLGGYSPSLTLGPAPPSSRPANPAGQQLTTNSPGLSNEKNSLKIWSNPVSKTLSLIIHTTNKSKVITIIYDSKGALIQTKKDQLLTGKNVINIDTRGIAAGIYYIQSQWSDGKARASATFVKQ